jgi:putative component of membrane protein insertase Oxa1/YidC/SpoIIIJ protein YidD
MSPAARATDALIRAYQVHLSPHKSWSCAYRVAHGGPSCSAAVRRVVRDRGMLRALGPTLVQLLACHRAARLVMANQNVQGVCCCGGIPIPFRF